MADVTISGLPPGSPSGSAVVACSDGVSTFKATVSQVVALASGVPAGTILDFAGSSAPAGYLLCDGSAVSRSTYSDLFAVINTIWGAGNGSTTFNVPDLRRRATVGSGGTGSAALANTVGSVGGAEAVVLTGQQSGVPEHGHRMNARTHGQTGVTAGTNGYAHSGGIGQYINLRLTSGQNNGFASGGVTNYEWNTGSVITGWTGAAGTNPTAITGFTTGSLNASESHNNLQPSAIVNKIIKI